MFLSIGMFSSGWPAFITGHAWIVWMTLFLGLAIISIGFFVRGNATKEAGDTVQSNTVGRDNNGMQLNSAGGTHIYGDSALQALIPKPPPAPPPVPIAPLPDLRFNATWRWAEIVYEMSPGLWKQSTQFDYDKDPKWAFLVSFSRPVPDKGQTTARPIPLVAILKFTHIGGEMSIPRAYWLGLTQHEVEFGVGHLESVVVGRLENHLFSSYINRYQHDGSNDYFDVPLRQLGERKAMPAINSISVEISLFDVNTNMTVEQKEYKITFSQGNVRPSISEESF